MRKKSYFLILGMILLVVLAFGCATSSFQETPKEECLGKCADDLEVCKEGCTEAVDEPEQAAGCIDQCEKEFFACKQKCPQ
jgi:hypothetical protein